MQAFLFSGQGSQKQGMGQDLVKVSRHAELIYNEASSIAGFDILNLSEQQLTETKFAQLAIVTMSLAAWTAYIHEAEIVAEIAYAGFSLGEYSALAAAGVIELPQLFELVNVRAELMQEAAAKNPGAMYAVLGLEDDIIEKILKKNIYEDRVFAVNYNCPGQLVISGLEKNTNDAATELLASGARRCVKLNVNGAFHTPFMQDAADKLETFATGLNFSQAKGAIYSNADAAAVPDIPNWPSRLKAHMCSPVRWSREIEQIRDDGCSHFFEFGYGRVLTGLMRKIDRSLFAFSVDSSDALSASLK